ncbi:FMN reductase [Corynebacterium sp. 32222D000AT]|uniref:FMN reductase n=1 Tax=unclassified Corynebacterium TaxID=2624378 RepID=UPI002A9398BD|nr:FMN reductase [Corynebacterium sp.]
MHTLVVVTAGLSTPSTTRQLGEELAAATEARVTARGEGLNIEFIEARNLAQDLTNAMTNWGAATPALDDARRLLSSASALIAVTPVFQGSYSGLFKMFFDTLDPQAITGMPTLIAATGGSSRHALILDYALRPLMNYLHAVVVPTGIYRATEDYGAAPVGGEAGHGGLSPNRISQAAEQLADLIVTPTDRVGGLSASPADTRSANQRRNGIDYEDDFTPMSELLGGETEASPGPEASAATAPEPGADVRDATGFVDVSPNAATSEQDTKNPEK